MTNTLNPHHASPFCLGIANRSWPYMDNNIMYNITYNITRSIMGLPVDEFCRCVTGHVRTAYFYTRRTPSPITRWYTSFTFWTCRNTGFANVFFSFGVFCVDTRTIPGRRFAWIFNVAQRCSGNLVASAQWSI